MTSTSTRTGSPRYRAPRRALLWTEQLRASAEASAFCAALPQLLTGPHGDGHRVLVLPGFLADDASTVVLRRVLRARGFRVYGWGLGRNIGPSDRIVTGMVDRLADLHGRDGEPVSLVGWSLGGILARELARLSPDQVRCVITMGSPFRLTAEDDPSTTHPGRLFEALKPWHSDLLADRQAEEDRPALQMPATAIYSKLDGIVPWQTCMDVAGPQRESVEVSASHLGMGVHPHVQAIVIDRLRQPVGQWQPYRRHAVAA
ncbi:MAG TPA: alpha/beta hydrolase [Nocardioides sp.]|nr:alpha/beta hydrolase [Nocardioides sp.]